MRVLQFPLIKITASFVLGLLIAHYTKPAFLFSLIAVLLSLLTLFSVYFYAKSKLVLTNLFGITALSTALFIGIFTSVTQDPTRNKTHYIHSISDQNKNCAVVLIIKEKLKTTAVSNRYVAQIISLDGKATCGKVLLNLKKSTPLKIDIGSKLQAVGTIRKTKPPMNPNQFDYGKYLENQHIYGQMYVNSTSVKSSRIKEKSVFYYAGLLRNRIIQNLEKNHFHKSELSVVVALILGQQQDISPEIVRDYQYAGAVHVLSVSGLHVGFILLFITFLLKPFPNSRSGALVKLIIVITFLWAFGLLAGFAPSVVRSVTMFSFVAVGMFLRRSVNIYNTIAISALLILLFQPSFLMDVGFQLSYVALYFIVWLQPLLASLWTPKYKLTSYLWDIITVSFAAQIGTFPMSIYYFHQFPGLFFITNLVILPGMSLILGLGVIVMFLAAFDWIWLPLLKALEWSIWLLNKVINWVASFEGFVFKDIPLSIYIMWGLYALIFCVIIWFKKPTFKKLLVVLFVTISLQSLAISIKYFNQKVEELLVFNCKGASVITKRYGDQVTVYFSNNSPNNNYANLALNSYLVGNSCDLKAKDSLANLIYFKRKKILVIDREGKYLSTVASDILLLVNNPKINMEKALQTIKPKLVVADGSNYKYYCKLWKATCKKQKIPFHNTAEKGFYKL
jgi:competence protein ComEC